MAAIARMLTMFVYALTGTAFLAAGAATLLVNTGLLPDAVRNVVVNFSRGDGRTLHLVQEAGALLVLAGLLTFWFLFHYDQSRYFHRAMTAYWAIMALIHWFHAAGPSPSAAGPVINTIPFVVYALLGAMRTAAESGNFPDAG